MAALTLDELLARPHLRTATVKIAGVGEVVLHEPTAAARWKIAEEIEAAEATTPQLFARWILRSIMAWDEPTDEQVVKLCECVGDDVLTEIFKSLCSFGTLTIDEAKKN